MPQPNHLIDLCEQERFEEIAACWKAAKDKESYSIEEFRAIMKAHYRLKRYEECLNVYKSYHKQYHHGSDQLHDLDPWLGWSLYHAKLKYCKFTKEEVQSLKKLLDFIFEHSKDGDRSPRWIVTHIFANAVDAGKLPPTLNHTTTLEYLNQITPDLLSDTPQRNTNPNIHAQTLPSDRESYYSLKTRLLLQFKEYEACIACCDQALRTLRPFHSNNDSWFLYRKAKCLCQLNRTDEARAHVEQILKSGFRHWCVLQQMFIFEAEAGNTGNALRYAGECALSDPEHRMRVSFYESLSDYLEQQNETESAMLLRRLVLLIRTENNWRTKNHYAQWPFTEEIAAMDTQTVLRRLNPVWREWRDKDKEFLTGAVVRLLPEGKSGFIRADNGSEYYFSARDLHGRHREPQVGMRVRFSLMDRIDKRKGIIKPNAVDITVM